jgi:hypothetical protein
MFSPAAASASAAPSALAAARTGLPCLRGGLTLLSSACPWRSHCRLAPGLPGRASSTRDDGEPGRG